MQKRQVKLRAKQQDMDQLLAQLTHLNFALLPSHDQTAAQGGQRQLGPPVNRPGAWSELL